MCNQYQCGHVILCANMTIQDANINIWYKLCSGFNKSTSNCQKGCKGTDGVITIVPNKNV